MTAGDIREIRVIRGKDLVSSRPLAEDCLLEYNVKVAGKQFLADLWRLFDLLGEKGRQLILDFGRDPRSDPHSSTEREWPITNDLAGYASGALLQKLV